MRNKEKTVGVAWVLQTPDGKYPDARSVLARLTEHREFTHVYDSRDNREIKAPVMSAIYGVDFNAVEI